MEQEDELLMNAIIKYVTKEWLISEIGMIRSAGSMQDPAT
jgi:hypothetical protein